MRLSDFTTVELQRVARAVLRRYLEVQAGAAPAVALARFLAPVAGAGLQRLVTDSHPRRLARHADLGPVTLLRLGPDRAYGTAALARPGQEGAPAVLSVELEMQGQRLVAVRVGEVERPELERRERLEVVPVGRGQSVAEPPTHLAGLLGGIPANPEALARWVSAAAVIDTYRERYGVDDLSSGFGPIPPDPEQLGERERALAYVRQFASEIEAIEPQQGRALGRDQPAGPELGR